MVAAPCCPAGLPRAPPALGELSAAAAANSASRSRRRRRRRRSSLSRTLRSTSPPCAASPSPAGPLARGTDVSARPTIDGTAAPTSSPAPVRRVEAAAAFLWASRSRAASDSASSLGRANAGIDRSTAKGDAMAGGPRTRARKPTVRFTGLPTVSELAVWGHPSYGLKPDLKGSKDKPSFGMPRPHDFAYVGGSSPSRAYGRGAGGSGVFSYWRSDVWNLPAVAAENTWRVDKVARN